MNRLWTKNATGVATDGRWYAGDVNALQDAVAAAMDLAQVIGLGTIEVGESGLQIVRYGAGDMRITGALRADGIVRSGLGGSTGGILPPSMTSTQRDSIPAGLRPPGLFIFNTTTNRHETNLGSDATPNWQPMSLMPVVARKTTPQTVTNTTAETDLLNGEFAIAANALGTNKLARVTAFGDWIQNSGGERDLPRWKFYLGGTLILDTSATGISCVGPSATRYGWRAVIEVMNLGATNSQRVNLLLHIGSATGTGGASSVDFIVGGGRYGPAGTAVGAPGGINLAEGGNSAAKDSTGALAVEFKVINPTGPATVETKLLGATMEIL